MDIDKDIFGNVPLYMEGMGSLHWYTNGISIPNLSGFQHYGPVYMHMKWTYFDPRLGTHGSMAEVRPGVIVDNVELAVRAGADICQPEICVDGHIVLNTGDYRRLPQWMLFRFRKAVERKMKEFAVQWREIPESNVWI